MFFLNGPSAWSQTNPLPPNSPLKIRLEFRVTTEDLPELRDVLLEFARSEHLTVEDIGAQMPPRQGRPLFDFELHQGDALEVTVINIREETRMFVWIYEYRQGSNLKEIDSKLERVLRDKWPTLAPYEGS